MFFFFLNTLLLFIIIIIFLSGPYFALVWIGRKKLDRLLSKTILPNKNIERNSGGDVHLQHVNYIKFMLLPDDFIIVHHHLHINVGKCRAQCWVGVGHELQDQKCPWQMLAYYLSRIPKRSCRSITICSHIGIYEKF